MKKIFAFVLTIALVIASNTAFAKFTDEYKAQYPNRVKTTTEQLSSGQWYTKTEYKLFDRGVEHGRLKLILQLNDKGPDLCFLSFRSLGNSSPKTINSLSWGGGEKAHDIKMFFSYLTGAGHHCDRSYAALGMAHINPTELKQAIVISANDEVVLNQSHKRWKEWQEALDAAEKILEEIRLERRLAYQKKMQEK